MLGKDPSKARHQILANGLNVGAEHYDKGTKHKSTAVVYRQEPAYTGMASYELGTTIELWYKEMSQAEIDKMVREFRVDSSNIVTNDALEDSIQKALSFEFNEW